MQLLGTCRLVDVLAEWGSHNTEWRWGTVRDTVEALEMVLVYYSPLVAKILAAHPIACFRAEFGTEDLPQIVTWNTRQPLCDRAAALQAQQSPQGDYVRKMVDSPERVTGPLICTCVGEVVDNSPRLRPPFLLFDGWHRGAAWVLQGRAGKNYPIAARLIATKQDARLPRQGES